MLRASLSSGCAFCRLGCHGARPGDTGVTSSALGLPAQTSVAGSISPVSSGCWSSLPSLLSSWQRPLSPLPWQCWTSSPWRVQPGLWALPRPGRRGWDGRRESQGGDGDMSSCPGPWGPGGQTEGEMELCPGRHAEHLPALPCPGAWGPAGWSPPPRDPCAARPPGALPDALHGSQRAPARGHRADISPRPQMPYRLAPVCTDIKVFASSCWRLTNPPVCFVYAIFFPPTWAYLMLWAFCKHFRGNV